MKIIIVCSLLLQLKESFQRASDLHRTHGECWCSHYCVVPCNTVNQTLEGVPRPLLPMSFSSSATSLLHLPRGQRNRRGQLCESHPGGLSGHTCTGGEGRPKRKAPIAAPSHLQDPSLPPSPTHPPPLPSRIRQTEVKLTKQKEEFVASPTWPGRSAVAISQLTVCWVKASLWSNWSFLFCFFLFMLKNRSEKINDKMIYMYNLNVCILKASVY